jgi:crotonobetainyl-CoA:carnitine CoA-transferase CaiB-like acyl-CoA transferase
LQAGGAITETLTGAFAAAATLLGVLGRMTHGHGEHVDVSAQEATLAGALFPSLRHEYYGDLPVRNSRYGPGPPFILPTRQGYIGVNVLTAPQWTMLCEFLGRPDIATNPRYAGRDRTRLAGEIREAFEQAVRDRTAAEVFHEGELWRVPFGLVPSMAEIVDLRPHKERGFFVWLDHPVAGRVAVPGVPFRSTVTNARPSRPPLLGEHSAEVLAEAGLTQAEIAALRARGVVGGPS